MYVYPLRLRESGRAPVYNATGVRVRELPITPEKVAMGILEQEAGEKK